MELKVKERKSKFIHSVIIYKHFSRLKIDKITCYTLFKFDNKIYKFEISGYELEHLKDMFNLYRDFWKEKPKYILLEQKDLFRKVNKRK